MESWEFPYMWNPTCGNNTRTIQTYTNAAFIKLLVKSKDQGSLLRVFLMVKGGGSYAEWENVSREAGTLSTMAHNANGTQLVATAMWQTNGKSVALVLSPGCPSAKVIGTGETDFHNKKGAPLFAVKIIRMRATLKL
jgi:hypothetical protein